MTRNSEAWWVCSVCNKKVQKVGKGGGKIQAYGGHRKICPKATYSMKQVEQGNV